MFSAAGGNAYHRLSEQNIEPVDNHFILWLYFSCGIAVYVLQKMWDSDSE